MLKLYPHQQAALAETQEQNKVAYYLDMGLGKTFVGSEKMKDLGAKVQYREHGFLRHFGLSVLGDFQFMLTT